MTEQPKLKPCPFCGSTNFAIYPGAGYYRVECRDCKTSQTGGNEFDAISAWNTRPIEDAMRAELAKRPTCATCKARYMAACFADDPNTKDTDYCSRWEAKNA